MSLRESNISFVFYTFIKFCKGKYSDAKARTCASCPAGTFIGDDGETEALHSTIDACGDCSAGLYSGSGSASCESCPSGTNSDVCLKLLSLQWLMSSHTVLRHYKIPVITRKVLYCEIIFMHRLRDWKVQRPSIPRILHQLRSWSLLNNYSCNP